MKVIFLDIDGVLNCSTSKSGCGYYTGIDHDKLARLKYIVECTGAKIVLCSSWKEQWFRQPLKDLQDESANYLDRKFRRERLTIMDKTEDHVDDRGAGILKWKEKLCIESFVILDDELFDYEETGLIPYLVKTDYENGGLQDIHAEQAIAILNSI